MSIPVATAQITAADLPSPIRHFESNADLDADHDKIMKNYGRQNLTLGMTVGGLWRDMHGDDSHEEVAAAQPCAPAHSQCN